MSDSPPRTRRDAVPALQALARTDTLQRARQFDLLDRQLRAQLDSTLAAHVRLANVDGSRLVFLVDGPIWHARLRLLGPDLLQHARNAGLDVASVVVKIARAPLFVEHPALHASAPFQPRMSSATAQALQSALASLRDAPTVEDDD